MKDYQINIGTKFGRWEVISKPEKIDRHVCLTCKCECGTTRSVRISRLNAGTSKSCGCLVIDLLTTHGHTAKSTRKDSHEYWIWNMVVQRCTNPNVKNWNDYGGRGITVCESWLKFEQFFADMGKRPTTKHSLERIDNNAGYHKDNCVWATRMEQAKNKRNNRVLTVGGASKHLAEWAREFCVDHTLIIERMKRGWSAERAITTPPRPMTKLPSSARQSQGAGATSSETAPEYPNAASR